MPSFSRSSKKELATCHKDLQLLFSEVVKHFDCTIIEGHRSEERQNQLYKDGHTKARFPQSEHNSSPSRAVDVAPYPLDFYDRERITYFAGFVLGTAKAMGISIRWGGDWDGDTEVKDNGFDDLVHFELT